MNIDLPKEQLASIDSLVAAGRFSSAEEAIREGIRLLVSRERLRQQVQTGIDQADRGKVTDHDTVVAELGPSGFSVGIDRVRRSRSRSLF
jgi:putative addiction module CopG family antidote